MAIAYVRDTGKVSTTAAASSNASFGTLPSVNNHVFALVSRWNNPGTSTTFSDNQANTWATDKHRAAATGLQSASAGSAKVATSSGTFTVTAAAAGSNYWEWIGVEFSGLASASHLDQTGEATQGTGSTSITVTAAGANAQADDLVLAVCANSSSDATINISHPPTGYTGLAVQQNATATCGHESCYKIVSALETSACTWTYDSTTGEGVSAAIATYKAAAGGFTPFPRPRGEFAGMHILGGGVNR